MMKKGISWLLLFALFLSIIQIVHVNQKYPNPTTAEAELGEIITNNQVSLIAKEAHLSKVNLIDKDFKIEVCDDNGNILNEDDAKVLLVSLSYSNTGKEKVEIPLYPYIAVCGGWSNGISQELFTVMNPDTSLMLRLGPDEERDVILPYILYSVQFAEEKWKDIEKCSFELVLSSYPTKSLIKLNNYGSL